MALPTLFARRPPLGIVGAITLLLTLVLFSWSHYTRPETLGAWSGAVHAVDAATLSWTQDAKESFVEFDIAAQKAWSLVSPIEHPNLWTNPPSPSLSSSPLPQYPTQPYTACILYLTRLTKLWDTAASLQTVIAHLPMMQSRPYPILLLHDGDLDPPAVQEEWGNRWEEAVLRLEGEGKRELAGKMRLVGRLVEFVRVDLGVPEGIARLGLEGLRRDGAVGGEEVEFAWRWPGYQSMCRFFTTMIFTHPRISQFDYYMRMDTDSFLLSSFPSDPFAYMHARSLAYAYRSKGTDPEAVVAGLRSFVVDFTDSHPHLADAIHSNLREDDEVDQSVDGGRFPMFDTNFEVVHVPSFRGERGVQEWLEALRGQRAEKSFYKLRWGDAPLRRATTAMFFPPPRVKHFCGFDYRHGGSVYEAEEGCDI